MNLLSSLIPVLPRQPRFKAQALLWLLKKNEKEGGTPAVLQLRLNTLTCLLKGEEDAFIYSAIGSLLKASADVRHVIFFFMPNLSPIFFSLFCLHLFFPLLWVSPFAVFLSHHIRRYTYSLLGRFDHSIPNFGNPHVSLPSKTYSTFSIPWNHRYTQVLHLLASRNNFKLRNESPDRHPDSVV